MQDEIGQEFCPYRKFSVVVDQSHCSEFVHEVPDKSLAFIGSAEARHPCASGNVPAILCDEWSEAQVKAFRLLANLSLANYCFAPNFADFAMLFMMPPCAIYSSFLSISSRPLPA